MVSDTKQEKSFENRPEDQIAIEHLNWKHCYGGSQTIQVKIVAPEAEVEPI